MERRTRHPMFTNIALATAMGLALCVLWWVYQAGLSGGFLLDDVYNLRSLGHIAGELTWENVKNYLNDGLAGPTGRPISLLSFLADSTKWPSSPAPFKATNVMLHGLNSLMVSWLALLMIRRTSQTSSAPLIAVLIGLAWAFNPYHVSTVLYVVQRMTLLSSFFVLLGMILYFKGRLMLDSRDNDRRGIGMIMCAYLAGLLGVLSKENAALFVLMVLLIEWVFFRNGLSRLKPKVRRVMQPLIIAPAFLFGLALIIQFPSILHEYEFYRDFSLSERLMTQARTLGYYLWRYLIPGKDYIGLYGDTFGVSRSLITPPSTLAWSLLHISLIAGAILVARRLPLVVFGVLFFYVGHLMESSFIPLNLFFEHRNYLPSAFLLLPLVAVPARKTVLFILALFVLTGGIFLQPRVALWGDDYAYRVAQAEKHPDSSYAVLALASWHIRAGENDVALQILRDFSARNPANIRVASVLMKSACRAEDVQESDIELFKKSPHVRKGRPTDLRDIGLLAAHVESYCAPLDHQDLREFLEVYLSAFPRDAARRQAYYHGLAIVEGHADNVDGYATAGMMAVREHPHAGLTFEICGTFARNGARSTACSCLKRGEYAFHGSAGSRSTVTRALLGYHDEQNEAFQHFVQSTCSAQPQEAETAHVVRDPRG